MNSNHMKALFDSFNLNGHTQASDLLVTSLVKYIGLARHFLISELLYNTLG